MGLSKAWPTHPAANCCAQDDSSPHQLDAPWVFGRTSRWRETYMGVGLKGQ